jgi:hypothetical protein
MTDTKPPVAILAADVPARPKRSNYPEPFAASSATFSGWRISA